MSHSMIFETKFVRLSDGRYIHFDRSGCNNDNAGRSKSEFTAKICTREDVVNKVKHFMEGSKPYKESKCFELKIGSKSASYYDYGKHLLRMLKAAAPYDEFISLRNVSGQMYKGCKIIEPVEEYHTYKENFSDWFYSLISKYGRISYVRDCEPINIIDEQETVKILESGIPTEFYIGKKIK